MSQNGPFSPPPWSSGGKSDKPYGEPADPWADAAAGVPDPPEWGASIPHQPMPHSAPFSAPSPLPPPPPPKRNTPIIALVVTLSVLVVVGLGTAWLLKERNDRSKQQAQPTPSATTNAGAPAPLPSEDARFSKAGDCVVNEGSNAKPDMRITACTSGAYEVLKRFTGRTTGEKDAEAKCAKVKGYTKWYFYDSALDELDFVLCMKEHKRL